MASLMKGDVMKDVAVRLLSAFKKEHQKDFELEEKMKS